MLLPIMLTAGLPKRLHLLRLNLVQSAVFLITFLYILTFFMPCIDGLAK